MKKLFLLIICVFFLSVTHPSLAQTPTMVNYCICGIMGIVTTDKCQVSTPGNTPTCKAISSGMFDCSCPPIPSSGPTNPTSTNNYLCTDGLSVNTALGCVPIQMDKFIAWLLPKLFSISGGIAFLLMVYGFILITTSNGDPKAVQGAKETITSAVIGLLISIFAIFILRLIAIDILHIPGIS